MENKQTAIDWLIEHSFIIPRDIPKMELINQAKQMEADNEYETKQYWFGRGVLAGKEDRINELKPKK